ncbi:MAG TPA: cytochrome C oxidase subunit IV family protein [Patescibacteria group bacterium]|nr:cytochrome C oxidase subunit IV family protein [Patescibacteria group bacterium]
MSGRVHVVPVGVYVAVFLSLMVLTAATTGVAYLDLGTFDNIDLNTLAALTIAVAKMLLVVVFFMHVRHASSLTRLVIAAGFLWLVLLVAFTLTDVASRAPQPAGWGPATLAPSNASTPAPPAAP